MRWFLLLALAALLPSSSKALPPADYFDTDQTMYSFADLWVVRPLDVAVIPITSLTWVASLPLTSISDSADRSYGVLVRDPAEYLVKRPLGSFFDWENRDQTKPVVIKFSGSYTLAELSPAQETRYRDALKSHEERLRAIENESGLSESDRARLVAGEEKRWEDLIRRLLSL
ncbi:hypothetical protein EBZ02_00005 [bacterium]|nr:hypothetical protein [bacterium]NDA09217.1 hypothetical protein [Verrucomicrobiota bacterium]NDA25270.1 hypothetical protein [Verrucomicrobiota bacterium]